MSRREQTMRERLPEVPRRPGVYLFKAQAREGGKVLYVGKAKDLRQRLSSYFQKTSDLDPRKASMVAKARDFTFVVTDTELEALVLEANLIKQHRPRFNVILRDDKNYPYLKLTVNEPWPRLEVVRRIQRDGAQYFGPYIPASGMWESLDFINRHFGLRPCRMQLEKKPEALKPCIRFQMGRCTAPCAGKITNARYRRLVEETAMFLRGKRAELLEGMRKKMNALSEATRYEEAAEVRDRIRAMEKAWESQKIIAPELGDVDIAAIHREGDEAGVQLFFIRNGAMVGTRDYRLRELGGLDDGELLSGVVKTFYSRDILPPPEILVDAEPEDKEVIEEWLSQKLGKGVHLRVPQRGKKRELMDMARDNARHALERSRKEGADIEATLEELRERAGLSVLPRSIGAFDVSNISGAEAVGAFVLWREGEFVKEAYRLLRPREVEGIDDYAMMRESVQRVLDGPNRIEERPDLVVIDGGRGHLEAAIEALEGVEPLQAVVSVAKRPDRLFLAGSEEPQALDDRLPSSLLLRRIRDEAHRFAVGAHTRMRGRRTMRSPLENVPGIGPKRRVALLRHFKGLDMIRKATVEELAAVDGMNQKAAEALKLALSEEGR